MKSSTSPSSFGIGLAIFSMFFGAGNCFVPLYTGLMSKGLWSFAFLGLLVTAVLMPILGIFGVLRSQGDPLQFFGRIGKFPGLLVALFVIALLGPLGSTPRCIALSYATLVHQEMISMPLFAALACILIFICSLKKEYILSILGYLLTPILLLSLGCIIVTGIIFGPALIESIGNGYDLFSFGLLEGYKTMDLLAAFFFSSTILSLLKHSNDSGNKPSRLLFKGGLIGGGLLALVYAGFCYTAGMYADALSGIPQEFLLKRIAELLLRGHASIVVKIVIALACLTTAIALIAAFADFLQTQVLKNKIRYSFILAASLLVTYFVAIFEFSKISQLLSPILSVLYPGLIILTLVNCFFISEKNRSYKRLVEQ